MSKAEKQMYLADRKLEVMFRSSMIKEGVCVWKVLIRNAKVLVPKFVVWEGQHSRVWPLKMA